MFNKIKNFFNRSKKAIDNKCNEIYCKAQTACMRPYRTTLLMKRTIFCPL